ncbi:MAG: hypothetical protein ABWY50_04295 [Aeromicrobium sp.]
MSLLSHPIKKLTLLAAFGGGYVLGAKAGRERYEQIREAANQVKDDPRVQQAATRAEDLVRETATKVTEDPRVKDVVSRAEDIVRDAGLHTSDKDTTKDDDAPKATVTDDSSATPKHAAPPTPADVAKSAGTAKRSDDDEVNPLLADAHTGLEEEVVYTSGPDIEESIDQLADLDSTKNPAAEDTTDNA